MYMKHLKEITHLCDALTA